MDQDSRLIRKMRKGEQEAFYKFTNQYYADIYQYCFRKTLQKEQAEDLTQETFVNFFSALDQYRHKGKAKNFLYTCARNLCMNYFVKNKKESLVLALDEDVVSETAEGTYIEIEDRITLRQMVGCLPETESEILILYYFQQLKIREIGELLQMKQSLVKYRLYQGIDHLKGMIRKEDWE